MGDHGKKPSNDAPNKAQQRRTEQQYWCGENRQHGPAKNSSSVCGLAHTPWRDVAERRRGSAAGAEASLLAEEPCPLHALVRGRA